MLCAVVGGISDLAQPIGPFATIIAICALIALAVVLMALLLLWRTSRRELLLKITGVIGMLATTSIGLTVWQNVVPGGGQSGVTAAHSEFARKLQSSLFAIEGHLVDIKGGLAELKRETSSDPRKELANRGIAWSSASFDLALRQSDVETLRLFVAGGFDWSRTPFIFGKLVSLESQDAFELFATKIEKIKIIACNISSQDPWKPDALYCKNQHFGARLKLFERLGRRRTTALCGSKLQADLNACKKIVDANFSEVCGSTLDAATCKVQLEVSRKKAYRTSDIKQFIYDTRRVEEKEEFDKLFDFFQ